MPSRRRQTPIHLHFFFVLLLRLAFAHDVASVNAQESFNCGNVQLNGHTYDLSSLGGESYVVRFRESTPTTMKDEVRFNLCADLEKQSGVLDEDQCPSGTRACLVKTNQRSNEQDRVVAVIPLTQSSQPQPYVTALPDSTGIRLVFNGPEWPTSGPSTPQFFNISLVCDTSTSSPEFASSDPLSFAWKTPSACRDSGNAPHDDEELPPGSTPDQPKERRVGSGIGWFFLVLLLALATYFVLGAYYNYTTYGASGSDLIPHRDFWREVPFMLRDVLSHLCSTFRPRHSSNRGGYIAV